MWITLCCKFSSLPIEYSIEIRSNGFCFSKPPLLLWHQRENSIPCPPFRSSFRSSYGNMASLQGISTSGGEHLHHTKVLTPQDSNLSIRVPWQRFLLQLWLCSNDFMPLSTTYLFARIEKRCGNGQPKIAGHSRAFSIVAVGLASRSQITRLILISLVSLSHYLLVPDLRAAALTNQVIWPTELGCI